MTPSLVSANILTAFRHDTLTAEEVRHHPLQTLGNDTVVRTRVIEREPCNTPAAYLAFTTFDVNVTYAANLATHAATNVENFIGGQGNDRFEFRDFVSVVGFLDGWTGTDTFICVNCEKARRYVLTALGAQDGFRGAEQASFAYFTDMEKLIGSRDIDSLTGLDGVSSTWRINSTAANRHIFNTYECDTCLGRLLSFGTDGSEPLTAIENLVGGAARDYTSAI